MYITKWNPTKSFFGANDFDFFLNDIFTPASRESAVQSWSPKVDISEDEKNYYANFELPGMTKDGVAVLVEKDELVVKGERKQEKADEGTSYHRIERAYGSFERRFKLADEIDVTKIDATFKDGILTVLLPKSEMAPPKELQIKIK